MTEFLDKNGLQLLVWWPVVGGCVCMLIAAVRAGASAARPSRAARRAAAVFAAAQVVLFGAVLARWFAGVNLDSAHGWIRTGLGADIALSFTGVSAPLVAAAAAVALVATVRAAARAGGEGSAPGSILFVTAAVTGLAMAADLLLLVAFFEAAVLLGRWLLRSPPAPPARRAERWLTGAELLAGSFVFAAVMLLAAAHYARTQTLSFAAADLLLIDRNLPAGAHFGVVGVLGGCFVLQLVVALAPRLGRLRAGRAGVGEVVGAVAMLLIAAAGLLRVVLPGLRAVATRWARPAEIVRLAAAPPGAGAWAAAGVWAGAGLLVLAGLAALAQRRIRPAIAALVAGQFGFLAIVLASGAPQAGIHAYFVDSPPAAGAFCGVAVVLGALTAILSLAYLRRSGRPAGAVADLAGLHRTHPGAAGALGAAVLCLCGAPLTAGFFARVFALTMALVGGWFPAAVVAAVGSALMTAAALRLLAAMLLAPAEAAGPAPPLAGAAGQLMRTAITAAVVVVMLLGLLPQLVVEPLVWVAN
jgi:formate hydrogenlyase subunit 3/multisubunit Na+/H+ antiporter MnhD subunit